MVELVVNVWYSSFEATELWLRASRYAAVASPPFLDDAIRLALERFIQLRDPDNVRPTSCRPPTLEGGGLTFISSCNPME